MRFNLEDYQGKYAMHCDTEEKAKVFCDYLHSQGREWANGDSYKKSVYWKDHQENTVYIFNKGYKSKLNYAIQNDYTILKFNDFDWSDNTKTDKHKAICDELNKLYISKNREYGDSFGKAVDDLGVYSAVVQMYHKLQRIINISKADKDLEYESLEDNLKDLANYAIMTIVELEERRNK